jgi:signal peptidase II
VPEVQTTPGTTLSGLPRRSATLWWTLALAGGWITLDQATKNWAVQTLAGQPPVPVVGQWLQLRLVYNSGAAFSLGTGSTWVFTLLASVVVLVLVWNAPRVTHRGYAVALGLLLGGAGGNLFDRLLRDPGVGHGEVVDFLALPSFPVFNVADIGISCAALLIGVLVLRGEDFAEPDATDSGPGSQPASRGQGPS